MLAHMLRGSVVVAVVVVGLMLGLGAPALQANEFLTIEFDTELISLNLSGGPFPIPLASDPGNDLGDSVEGYGFVDSLVTLTLSSQRAVSAGPQSFGHVTAVPAANGSSIGLAVVNDPAPIDPDALDGQLFAVDSFFDVFFDITFTDVDTRPGRDYAGQADGASVALLDNGPTLVQSLYGAVFDKDAPNFGLIPPPEADPWTGFFQIEIPLGGDINGNGTNDKIKFTLGTIAAGDSNRTFIQLPDGTVIDEFDAGATFDAAIVDETSDPPFSLTGLSGPTTATSTLLNPLAPVIPEPASLGLIGLALVAVRKRRRD